MYVCMYVLGAPLIAQSVKNPQPTLVFLPRKSHGQRRATVHGVTRVGHDLVTKPQKPHTHAHIYLYIYSLSDSFPL